MKKATLLIMLFACFTAAYAQNEIPVTEEIPVTQDRINDANPPEIFQIVEQMPEFPGGDQALYAFLGQNIQYPADAVKKGLEDKVIVRFIVDQNGQVTEANVAYGKHDILNEEALRVVSLLPDFVPGRQKGKAVKVWFTLPVLFQLTDPNDKKKKK